MTNVTMQDVLGDAASGVLVGFTPTNTPVYLAWRGGLVANIDTTPDLSIPLIQNAIVRSMHRLNGRGAGCLVLAPAHLARQFVDDARTFIVDLQHIEERAADIDGVLRAVGCVVVRLHQRDGFHELSITSLWRFIRQHIADWQAPPLFISFDALLPFDLAQQMTQLVVGSVQPAHVTIRKDQDMWQLVPFGSRQRDALRFALEDGAMIYLRHKLTMQHHEGQRES